MVIAPGEGVSLFLKSKPRLAKMPVTSAPITSTAAIPEKIDAMRCVLRGGRSPDGVGVLVGGATDSWRCSSLVIDMIASAERCGVAGAPKYRRKATSIRP